MAHEREETLIDTIKDAIPHPCKEGYPFIAIGFGATLLAFILEWQFFGTILLALSIWCVYFFRDPDRITPEGQNFIVSPADGIVHLIKEAVPPKELDMGDEPLTRISVFLNVFNVHVNRVPVGGQVTKLMYYPGKFVNASLDKASEENERQLVKVTMADGRDVGFIQIAGLVARRIVCKLDEGQQVKTGERFGLIRFGSRMDVFLPKGVAPLVAVGQVAVAGETIFADLAGEQKPLIAFKH